MFDRNVLGQEIFMWFVGVVESRQDPLALGRVKVRAYAIHSSNLADIPSNDLPWAIVAQAPNWDGVPTLKEGDVVWGIFLDGRSAQIPAVFFRLPGYNSNPPNQGVGFNDLRTPAILADAPRLPLSLTYNNDGSGIVVKNPSQASLYPLSFQLNKPSLTGVSRYDIANTVIQYRKNNLDKNIITAHGLTWSEPYPAYNPLYPYNKVIETESGHLFEMDDTPGSERITISHRAGSFIDMYPSGSKVQKVTKSNYSIIMGDDYLHVMGRVLVTVGEGVYIKVLGDAHIEVDNNLNLTANGDLNVRVGGDYNIYAQNMNQTISQDFTVVTGGNQYLTSAEQIEVEAATTVDIDGIIVNIQKGAIPGVPNNLSAPGPTVTPNKGVAGEEPVPIPFPINYQYLDAYTATALKHASLLNSSNTPDANVANTKCSFDVNTHTFLPSSSWSLNSSGLQALEQREGFAKALANGSCTAYPDPVYGSALLTIGYGCTQVVLPYTLTTNTVRTQAQAEQDLLTAVNTIFLPKLQQYVTVNLTANMVNALLSFMYNVGVNNFLNSSVLRYLNQKNWCASANSLLLWDRANGVVIPDLVNRRKSERTQFLT